jgi:hypothetical protein
MIEFKVIAKFDESMQRDVITELDKGINKSDLAVQLNTSRGTIIRIEKQMRLIIEAEKHKEDHGDGNPEDCDDVDGWDGEDGPYNGLRKIKRTPFMQMMFNW